MILYATNKVSLAQQLTWCTFSWWLAQVCERIKCPGVWGMPRRVKCLHKGKWGEWHRLVGQWVSGYYWPSKERVEAGSSGNWNHQFPDGCGGVGGAAATLSLFKGSGSHSPGSQLRTTSVEAWKPSLWMCQHRSLLEVGRPNGSPDECPNWAVATQHTSEPSVLTISSGDGLWCMWHSGRALIQW